MKNLSDISIRILTLIKLDSLHLLERIRDRKSEYLEVFALRRTREHFPHIFKSRYDQATLKDLSHCSVETIEVLDKFYTHVDELKWYLMVTEDMPNTVDDYISRKLIKLHKLYDMLALYIDADLGIKQENIQPKTEDNEDQELVSTEDEQRWLMDEVQPNEDQINNETEN